MSTTALVTGATSGIGLELCKQFAAHGHDLVLVARSESRLQQIAAELRRKHGVAVTALAGDLAHDETPERLHAALEAAGIAIDILVNNAGFGIHGAFAESNLDQQREILQVNGIAPMRLARLFLPHMLARKHGYILNVCSTASFASAPLMALYAASKAFALSFSEALTEELRGTGVHVTALCPGVTATGFQARARVEGVRISRGPTMRAEVVARAGYRALMRGRALAVPGLSNVLLLLTIRFAPRALVRRTTHWLMKSMPADNEGGRSP